MTKTLYEHTCDQCGEKRVTDKISLSYHDSPIINWFSVSQIKVNDSCGFTDHTLFCSIECLTAWSIREQMSLDTDKQLKS